MKKIISLVMALVMMFSVFGVISSAADPTVEDDYGIAPCFTNASMCQSSLTCSNIKASMRVEINRNSNVTKTIMTVYLLKYTSDGWTQVHQYICYDYKTGSFVWSDTATISLFSDYCMKTVVELYTSTNVETITQYRYS